MFEKCQTFITSHSLLVSFVDLLGKEDEKNAHPGEGWKGKKKEEFFRPKTLFCVCKKRSKEMQWKFNHQHKNPCCLDFFMFRPKPT